MNRRHRALTCCALALAGLLAAAAGHALTIEGLSAMTPVSATVTSTLARDGKLEIRYPGGQLYVHPWPDFLPAQLNGQTVYAERQLWPVGPADRLALTRAGESQPWLIIGSHSRISTPVLGDWKLEQKDGAWYLGNGLQSIALPPASAATAFTCVESAGNHWQVHLLPEENEGVSRPSVNRQEPVTSWVAVQR